MKWKKSRIKRFSSIIQDISIVEWSTDWIFHSSILLRCSGSFLISFICLIKRSKTSKRNLTEPQKTMSEKTNDMMGKTWTTNDSRVHKQPNKKELLMAPKKKTHNKSDNHHLISSPSTSAITKTKWGRKNKWKNCVGGFIFFWVVKRFLSDLLSCCCWCESGRRKCMYFQFFQSTEVDLNRIFYIFKIFTTRWIFESFTLWSIYCVVEYSTKMFFKSGLLGWNIQIFFLVRHTSGRQWAELCECFGFYRSKSESLSHSTEESDWELKFLFRNTSWELRMS